MAKKQISLTVDYDIYRNFKEYCKQNGMKVSTKVELLMRDSVKNTNLRKFIE